MKAKNLLLRNIPEDIFIFLLKEQNRIKESHRLSQYSLDRTVYGVIRASDQFQKQKEVVQS